MKQDDDYAYHTQPSIKEVIKHLLRLINDIFAYLHYSDMDLLAAVADNKSSKIASDLTIGTLLKSTAKFVKGGPVADKDDKGELKRYGGSETRNLIHAREHRHLNTRGELSDSISQNTDGPKDRLKRRKDAEGSVQKEDNDNTMASNKVGPSQIKETASQPSRYGSHKEAQSVMLAIHSTIKKQEEPVEPVKPPRYGTRQPEKTEDKSVTSEQPSSRYGRRSTITAPGVQDGKSTVTETEAASNVEEKKITTPQPSRYRGTNANNSSTKPTTAEQTRQTPVPAPRYGRKPQQQQEKTDVPKLDLEEKPQPAPRYGRKPNPQPQQPANVKKQSTISSVADDFIDNIITPRQRKGKYGAQKSPRTPNPSETGTMSKHPSEIDISPNQSAARSTNRFNRKPETTPTSNANSKVEVTQTKQALAGRNNNPSRSSAVSPNQNDGNISRSQVTRGVRNTGSNNSNNVGRRVSQISQKPERQPSNTREDQPKPKKSLIILRILAKISKQKQQSYLQLLHRNSLKQKSREANLNKFVRKICHLENSKDKQLVEGTFHTLYRFNMYSLENKTKANHTKDKELPMCKQLLASLLARLQKTKMHAHYDTFKVQFCKKRDASHIGGYLQRYEKNQWKWVFHQLVSKTSYKKANQNAKLTAITYIASKAHREMMRQPFMMLQNITSFTTTSVVYQVEQTPSPIKAVSQISNSPTKSDTTHKLQQLDQQTKKLEKQIQQQTEINQSSRLESKDELQFAHSTCNQLSHQISFKKQFSEDLKARIDSIAIVEEEYIKDEDNISDTKFPILAEIYIRVEKMAGDVSVGDLKDSYPFLSDDLEENGLVAKWGQFLKVYKLRLDIQAFEGAEVTERRAAKMVQQEIDSLASIARGYIRQKYAWQWVKTAISSSSVVSV